MPTQELQPGFCGKCHKPMDNHNFFSEFRWEADEELSYVDDYPKGTTAWKLMGHNVLEEPTCPKN
jgi:hypothetical protein